MTETVANEYWSMSFASKEMGINKGQLSQDISKGKIQWHDRPDGTRKLFAPELYNVYADRMAKRKKRLETGDNPVTSTENKPSENKDVTPILEAKDEVIALLKQQIEDIRQDRDHWRKQAEETTLIIKALPAPPDTLIKRKRFWLF